MAVALQENELIDEYQQLKKKYMQISNRTKINICGNYTARQLSLYRDIQMIHNDLYCVYDGEDILLHHFGNNIYTDGARVFYSLEHYRLQPSPIFGLEYVVVDNYAIIDKYDGTLYDLAKKSMLTLNDIAQIAKDIYNMVKDANLSQISISPFQIAYSCEGDSLKSPIQYRYMFHPILIDSINAPYDTAEKNASWMLGKFIMVLVEPQDYFAFNAHHLLNRLHTPTSFKQVVTRLLDGEGVDKVLEFERYDNAVEKRPVMMQCTDRRRSVDIATIQNILFNDFNTNDMRPTDMHGTDKQITIEFINGVRKNYHHVRVIQGGVGFVHIFMNGDEGLVIKVPRKTNDNKDSAAYKIMRLRCGNCLDLFPKMRTIKYNDIEIVLMELVHGDLISVKDLINEGNIIPIIYNICTMIKGLYDCGLFYLDIKADNVMVRCNTDGTMSVLLGDIESVISRYDATYDTDLLTYTFIPIDRINLIHINDKPRWTYKGMLNESDLVWVIGCFIFTMMLHINTPTLTEEWKKHFSTLKNMLGYRAMTDWFGKNYNEDTDINDLRQTYYGYYNDFDDFDHILTDPVILDLVKQMFAYMPNKRPSLSDIINILVERL